jgi:anti-sigma regulatory factor (Ser/Thr protein kinase)
MELCDIEAVLGPPSSGVDVVGPDPDSQVVCSWLCGCYVIRRDGEYIAPVLCDRHGVLSYDAGGLFEMVVRAHARIARARANALPFSLTRTPAGFQFTFADAVLAYYARKLFMAFLTGQLARARDLFGVELVFGELVGNVVRHAPGPVDIRLFWTNSGARLEVWDTGEGYEMQPVLPADAMSESHRGLFIVASYADELYVERRRDWTVTCASLQF